MTPHANDRHGHTKGRNMSKTYMVWASMLERCRNPNNKSFVRYGARGIVVCRRWLKFENFLADMGEKPVGRSLDRINNDGPYSPHNCRWATTEEQALNTSRNRLITFRGETLPVGAWAKRLGISRKVLDSRLNRRGWSVERALTQGVGAAYRPNAVMLTHDGETASIGVWAARIGVSLWALRKRLQSGWTVERALTTPAASNTKPREAALVEAG